MKMKNNKTEFFEFLNSQFSILNSHLKKGPRSLFLLFLFSFFLLASCGRGDHFIKDKEYRMQVHTDFVERQTLAAGRADALFHDMGKLKRSEREALEFLYAYMPYSDLADYDQDFFLSQVRSAFAARETMPWGKLVPEDIFRHFVLVYRVNNEDLDTARLLMYNELKDRVAGMTMEQAALEVNHWCHEHVAYRASDSRTSAPLATMRTSLGRCGEESTFAVTALRAVGIPARQCYTPRWAHCDDNHAWVEVWINDDAKEGGKGSWKFLGACEPDPKLDMGWFSVPSTRCMMVHTKVFGRYNGTEEALVSTPLYSELNLLSNYAPTRQVSVTVCSSDGRPVSGATVKFKLYNYAEYYTLSTVTTDDWGQAFFTTGLGDLLVWATDGTHYSFRKIDVRQESSASLFLGQVDTNQIHTLTMVPPAAGIPKETASEAEIEANAHRLAYEDAIRNAYTTTFPKENNVNLFVQHNPNLTREQVWEIISRSEGNYEDVARFINSHTTMLPHLYDYLRSFSDKDLRDTPFEVFEAHFTRPSAIGIPYEIYCKGLLPARISNELVRPYREELSAFCGRGFNDILRWTRDSISVDDTGNYYRCPISPVGVYRLRHADAHSRDIFFVAACRAASVPAYMDNATNIIYVWNGAGWQTVSFTDEYSFAESDKATLTLTYSGREPAIPVYWPHFTIARMEEGDLRTFDFEDDPRMSSFPAALRLEPGTYCLSTGNRNADGAVNSRLEFFTLKPGDKVSREIVIPPVTSRPVNEPVAPAPVAQAETPVAQAAPTASIGLVDRNIEMFTGIPLWDYAANPGMLYINLGNYGEPSKHLVVELRDHQTEMRQWGGMTYMVGPSTIGMEDWDLTNTDISFRKGVLEKRILDALQLSRQPEYPLVVLIDKNGRILYHSEGYRIGSVEQVLKAARR